jgi:hypothetical protein
VDHVVWTVGHGELQGKAQAAAGTDPRSQAPALFFLKKELHVKQGTYVEHAALCFAVHAITAGLPLLINMNLVASHRPLQATACQPRSNFM